MTLDRKIKWLFGLIVLANVIIVLVVALGTFEPPPPKPLPNPNGYDDFVKAGTMLKVGVGGFRYMKQPALAALVATNAEALKMLRVGLSHECLVPYNYSRDYITNVASYLGSVTELAGNLCAEGRLAEMQNRNNDAVQSYLDAMSFGLHCSQGGIMFSKQSGIESESLGRKYLQSLTNSFDSTQCRKIVRTLETADVKEEPVDFFIKQDKEFERKELNLREKIKMLINHKGSRNIAANFAERFKINQLHRRQMIIDFAARAYESEKCKPPATIADLIPDYLKAIPKDPVTGSNLVLHASMP